MMCALRAESGEFWPKGGGLGVLFIDALSYGTFLQLWSPSGLHDVWACPIRAEPGYSASNHMALLTGLGPDEAGTLCDWNPRDPDAILGYKRWGLDFFDRRPGKGRALIRRMQRVFGIDRANLPLLTASFFERVGRYPFSNVGILEEAVPELRRFWRIALSRGGADDFRCGNMFLEWLNGESKENFLATMIGLDDLGHAHGPQSLPVAGYLGELKTLFFRLRAAAVREGNRKRVVIVSDHGMVPVTKVLPAPENWTGDGRGGFSLTDSVYWRHWWQSEGEGAPEQMYQLAELGCGRILTKAERLETGISDRSFGDVIFVASPGYTFLPNDFSASVRLKAPRGMHGYLESRGLEDYAVVALIGCSASETAVGGLPSRVREFPRFLQILARGSA